MEEMNCSINSKYEKFYAQRQALNVYPTEFVVRVFLANYPNLSFHKPQARQKILDIGFGDGRNTLFLCEQEFNISGIEITQDIVDFAKQRMAKRNFFPDLRVGRNSNIPFENESFDYILACHSCYYCDESETLIDNLKEYSRVLKKVGFLIASVPNKKSYIFEESEIMIDGTYQIKKDPYHNREGYRLFAFSNIKEIEEYFSSLFENFSFGHAENDYFGIDEKVFWVVCQRK
jgi:SAM-dependent methyltransferase